MLKRLYKRAFDIRDGEITISFFMQLYIFLVITVLLIVKPSVNALFLSALGAERLPYGYLLVAIIAVLSSYFYNRALKKFSFKSVATVTLSTFCGLFLALALALHFRFLEEWVLYLYYVLISLFAVVATSQFWILANMVYNAREAKRLFGFIGAGAIAGGIFGGYVTTVISAMAGTKVAILLAAVLILCCVPILHRIYAMRLRALTVYARRKKVHQETTPSRNAFQIILQSKHLLYIALIVGVSVVVAKLVDFQFSDFAHKAIPDADELASFLGFWFSTFNVAALLIQLFMTNRVLSYLGVTSTLLILPLGIALGSLLFLTVPELWVLIIIKGLDGSFKQSLNKAATELSILPIPHAIKNQAKSFIDIVVDSIATGLAGFLLIFVIKGMELDTKFVTVLTLLFLFVWLVLIYKLRDAYFDSFRNNLKSVMLSGQNEKSNLEKDNTITAARLILSEGQEDEILTLLGRLSATKVLPLKSQIIQLLDHPSDRVKKAAVDQLYMYDKVATSGGKSSLAFAKAKSLLTTEHDALRRAVIQYILHRTKRGDRLFETYLNHNNKKIATAALLSLAQEGSPNSSIQSHFKLHDRIAKRIEEMGTPEGLENTSETAELLLTIAYSGIQEFYYFVSIHFSNKQPFVIKRAIEAAGITTDPIFIGHLLQFLEDKKLRKSAIKSLTQYGPEITRTLLRLDHEDKYSAEIKRHIPKIIASFKTQEAVRIQYKFLKSKDIITRYHSAKALQKLSMERPALRIDARKLKKSILSESTYYRNTQEAITNFTVPKKVSKNNKHITVEIELARETILLLLHEQLEMSLKSIFILLALRYNRDDITAAYFGIQSDDQHARINALEFLDNLLHISLKGTILPLLEFSVLEGDAEPPMAQPTKTLEFGIIKKLLRNRGKRIKIAMLHLIELYKDPRYIPLVRPLQKHRNKEIAAIAQRVYSDLKK